MTTSELYALARQYGIVILDCEDRESVAPRIEDLLGRPATEDEKLAALLEIEAQRGSIPLVTETEEGEDAVQAAIRDAMRALGVYDDELEAKEEDDALD